MPKIDANFFFNWKIKRKIKFAVRVKSTVKNDGTSWNIFFFLILFTFIDCSLSVSQLPLFPLYMKYLSFGTIKCGQIARHDVPFLEKYGYTVLFSYRLIVTAIKTVYSILGVHSKRIGTKSFFGLTLTFITFSLWYLCKDVVGKCYLTKSTHM